MVKKLMECKQCNGGAFNAPVTAPGYSDVSRSRAAVADAAEVVAGMVSMLFCR